MIDLRHVTKRFASATGSVEALSNVSLKIEAGEIFGVIGRSGAGKSTLIRCINLLERPTEGQVLVDGRDLMSLDAAALRIARREIGMIFQHFNLLSSRTVFDNVALPLELRGEGRAAIKAKVDPLLELVGLADKAGRYPSQLSGGQKQRVGIARALATDPKVLLCDEATSALDPETTDQILALIKDIRDRLKLTVVLITHEMAVVKEIADRVAVMEHGKVIEQGDTFDVFTRPQHLTTRSFVSDLIGFDLPPALQKRIADNDTADKGGRLLRILFTGSHADDPVISELSRNLNLDINILHGRIDEIQGRPFGVMVVRVPDDAAKIAAAKTYLTNRKLHVEELGHVHSLDRAAG
ncbi:methionine ABC transporter ATP-binding protein [uncultured Ferrovibrio sp.]|jgi:D-methionine transport system ATP-binding protein|uniref:methionine ABC transporter ATP-binding protein n=1 Tax=uncultured Ferrovibrio sp. TaxID=1576913 RepID=UPI002607B3EB|nr:methionine ABC transporter ATP-binding protein [uncultured Ferrovibrio sp.]